MLTSQVLTLTLRYQLVVLGLASVGTLLWWPAGLGGVLGGGMIAGLNFAVLRFLVDRIMHGERGRGGYALLIIVKFGVVLGALALLVGVVKTDAIGVALGLFSLFLGVGLASLHVALRAPNVDPANEN